jgi:hypothetical protein
MQEQELVAAVAMNERQRADDVFRPRRLSVHAPVVASFKRGR